MVTHFWRVYPYDEIVEVEMSYPWLTQWGSRSSRAQPLEPHKEVLLYDTTLRDGEQQANLCFGLEQKLRMFRAIERGGADLIETGMLPVHNDEQTLVRTLRAEGHTSKVYVLARALEADIDLAAETGADGVTIEMLVNAPLAELRFGWSKESLITRVRDAVDHAKGLGLEANVFGIDATRADLDWLCTYFAETSLNADYVTIADSFGVCDPQAMSAIVAAVVESVGVPVQVHCHEDFGLGVANSLAAVDAGAGVVQGTINGIGERAGNTSLPVFAAAARFLRGWTVHADFDALRLASKMVADESGIPLRPNAPIVGETLYDMEAGIVTGLYESMIGEDERHVWPVLPEQVGTRARIRLGKASGIANVRMLAPQFGWTSEEGTDAEGSTDLRAVLDLVKERGSELGRCLTNEEAAEVYQRVRQQPVGQPGR
jgi:methanogen homocitrate synthase